MHIGIAIEETWRFFNEIYADLSSHYITSLFKKRYFNFPFLNSRINRQLYHRDLQSFMRANDLVFFEWASELLFTATQFQKHCRIITRLHRYEMYQWVDKIKWDAVDKIILVSQSKKREFIERFPDQEHKLVVIPVGIDVNKFQPNSKSYHGDIGILCDLTPRKRVYDLILTFYELTKVNNGLHLHIGGGPQDYYGDYYLAILDLIKNLNIKDKIILYGNVEDTKNWYHNIDIFISNSYSEGLQVAPMEAMASGCYCLSHHWTGADELLPETNLFYTDKELQEKILNYSNSSESEKQLKREYMRFLVCEKFDIEQVKIRIRSIIDEVGANIGK
jgi:glycosyltransferase involved in cell wall biosynthesis